MSGSATRQRLSNLTRPLWFLGIRHETLTLTLVSMIDMEIGRYRVIIEQS